MCCIFSMCKDAWKKEGRVIPKNSIMVQSPVVFSSKRVSPTSEKNFCESGKPEGWR